MMLYTQKSTFSVLRGLVFNTHLKYFTVHNFNVYHIIWNDHILHIDRSFVGDSVTRCPYTSERNKCRVMTFDLEFDLWPLIWNITFGIYYYVHSKSLAWLWRFLWRVENILFMRLLTNSGNHNIPHHEMVRDNTLSIWLHVLLPLQECYRS